MPFKSTKQKKLMEIVAHDKDFAKEAGIKQSVAKKMLEHDKQPKDKDKKGEK